MVGRRSSRRVSIRARISIICAWIASISAFCRSRSDRSGGGTTMSVAMRSEDSSVLMGSLRFVVGRLASACGETPKTRVRSAAHAERNLVVVVAGDDGQPIAGAHADRRLQIGHRLLPVVRPRPAFGAVGDLLVHMQVEPEGHAVAGALRRDLHGDLARALLGHVAGEVEVERGEGGRQRRVGFGAEVDLLVAGGAEHVEGRHVEAADGLHRVDAGQLRGLHQHGVDGRGARDDRAAGFHQMGARVLQDRQHARRQHADVDEFRHEDVGLLRQVAALTHRQAGGQLRHHVDAVGVAVVGDGLAGDAGEDRVHLAGHHLPRPGARRHHGDDARAGADLQDQRIRCHRALQRRLVGVVALEVVDHRQVPAGDGVGIDQPAGELHQRVVRRDGAGGLDGLHRLVGAVEALQRVGQTDMGGDETGRRRDHHAEGLLGLLQGAARAQRLGKVVAGLQILRRPFQRGAEGGLRLVQPAQLAQGGAQEIVHLRRVAAQGQGSAEGALGVLQPAQRLQRVAQIAVKLRQAVVEGDAGAERRLRLRGAAELEEQAAAAVVEGRVLAVLGDGVGEEVERAVGMAGVGGDDAQQVQGLRVVRVGRQDRPAGRLRPAQIVRPQQADGVVQGRLGVGHRGGSGSFSVRTIAGKPEPLQIKFVPWREHALRAGAGVRTRDNPSSQGVASMRCAPLIFYCLLVDFGESALPCAPVPDRSAGVTSWPIQTIPCRSSRSRPAASRTARATAASRPISSL
ncbi:protein of unknown function [Azospirillum baldaniorum]|uniref:Uncharacterized protein n=1 Tax=Azospirillum baldaniorum TaxID=1064539 RepID=A0A9P1NKN2_9PROT|nr:protein of unknown function [Azospirillum baldaniorum]